MIENEGMFGKCLEKIMPFKHIKLPLIINNSTMASVHFRVKIKEKKKDKKKEIYNIYLILSIGRGKVFEVKSGFSIHRNDWIADLGIPKKNSAINKNIFSNLKSLEAFIHDSLNNANIKGELIEKFWLENKIKECFNRVESVDSEILINHIQYIIENASTRKVQGKNALGISKSRVNEYKKFFGLISRYQLKLRRKIRLTEINSQFVDDFTKWLLDNENYALNTAGKHIDSLKAVCNDARRLGLQVHPYTDRIRSFCEQDKDRNFVTLSFEEQEKIANTSMPTKSLENAKKWILIGCILGQRGNDLLNFSVQNHRNEDGLDIIDVWQEKSQIWVTVPIMSKIILDIILNEKPYKISMTNLNKYIKMVCEMAGIDGLTEGSLVETNKLGIKRSVKGQYPKWQLISSHCFRRSFATNYYKHISTPILMLITGHTRESTFLKYINKNVDKDNNARLFATQYLQMFKTKEIINQTENIKNLIEVD